ncbi:MAG: GxxExxY protein [Phycisphaerales bacterium]
MPGYDPRDDNEPRRSGPPAHASLGYGRSPQQDGPRQRRGTPLADLDPALTDVSRKVIGASIEVHKAIGPGFPEDVYLAALCAELDTLGVKYQARAAFDVKYRGKAVGQFKVDLYVDDRFFVDVCAEHREIGSVERAALRAQLRAKDLELGLIINFAEMRLKDGLIRVLNPDKLNAMKGPGSPADAEHSAFDPDSVRNA